MKKAFIIIACVAAMLAAGTSLKAQEVTITLMPGWTWISIPSTETMDFATALGSFTPAVGDRIKSQWGNATYRDNGGWRGQISEFYPGYGYKYYSTRQVPVSVTFNAQQPSQQVAVTTDTPQFITGNSAMGGGNVVSNDGTYILVKGLCWATHETPTSNDSYLEEGSGEGSFSATMTGLNWSTTYYVRAYAVTPSGTVYGEQQSFTTRDGIPTLTTDSITSITAISATCGGNITDDGGLSVTARGVCWSTSPNPTVSDSHTSNGTGTGSFTSSITNLEVSTTYYVRAYATTNAGTAYGEQQSFTTRDGIPTLTTDSITSITAISATSGGNITDDGGLNVTARGVCWSTNPNPTVSDSHTTNGTGTGNFSSSITGLEISTTYYVRAYATTAMATSYGEELSFVTQSSSVGQYVDLGLPSGRLWATCNVGAVTPEGYGDYYAWGEIQTKYLYTCDNYRYGFFYFDYEGEVGDNIYIEKYNTDSDYGPVDNLIVLQPDDDAATVNWGSDWCMPSKAAWLELYNNTTCIWTTQNGVCGRLFTASNGNSLFLPAAGSRWYEDMWGGEVGYAVDTIGCYWSSSLITECPYDAWEFSFDGYGSSVTSGNRFVGQSVRAVRSCAGDYVDLGLPSGVLWAICNIGANSIEEYGNYYAWGETQPKGVYNWSTYQYCWNGNKKKLTKYCNNSEYGYNGFTDNLTTLLIEDDAATANWGEDWRMPTIEEWQELYQNTTCVWTTVNGVRGRLFTAANGNSLFLPAAGCRGNSSLYGAGSYGSYWSSSLDTDCPYNAWRFYFNSDYCYMGGSNRYYGLSVRAVRSSVQN